MLTKKRLIALPGERSVLREEHFRLLEKLIHNHPLNNVSSLRGPNVPNVRNEKLEGITLSVYLYVVKKRAPVGAREAMKGAHLSSPSVAYRHLEKLEDLGLLQKNEYGEYVVKRKARLGGYVWFGRWMMPKMLVYSAVFLSILIVELGIFAVHFEVENFEFKVFFLLLTVITGLALAVFTVEGLLHRRRFQRSIRTEQAQNAS